MSVNITQFKDFNGAKIAPITPEAAVVDRDGVTLETKMDELMSINFPLQLSLSISASSSSNPTSMSVTATASIKNQGQTPVDDLTITINGTQKKTGASSTGKETVSEAFTKNTMSVNVSTTKQGKGTVETSATRYIFATGAVPTANLNNAFSACTKRMASALNGFTATINTTAANKYMAFIFPMELPNPSVNIYDTVNKQVVPVAHAGTYSVSSGNWQGTYHVYFSNELEAASHTWNVQIVI